MENFRRSKAHSRSSSAVDGFLRQGKTGSPRTYTVRQAPINNTGRSQINNFGGVDGFRPNLQPQLKTTAASTAVAQPGTWRSTPPVGDIVNPPTSRRRKQKQKLKKSHSKRRLVLKGFLSLFIFALLGGGFIAVRAFMASGKVFQGGGNAPALSANVDPTKLNGEGDGRVNILMLGKGGDGHQAPDLTDTIIVASIDPINKSASLLSIPRDLWVKSPSGGQSKINAVYANAKYASQGRSRTAEAKAAAEKAGLAAVETVVENTMGIPIHYYVLIDFIGFQKAINTVGGIDIYVSPNDASGIVRETLWDELTRKNYTLDVRAGQNHFDGQRALMYSRSRHTSTRGDFDRAERQRKVLIALKDKVLSAGTFGNPVKINQLISDFGNHVQSNLSPSEVMRVYDIMKSIESSKINSVGLADPPNNYVTTGNANGQSIVRPRAGLFDYSEIQNYVRNSLKDGYLKKESANIGVYNGSGIAGLASTKSTELKSFGYTITATANAPTNNYNKTIIVDLTKGAKKYTKHYLEQRFGVTATTTMPDNTIPTTGVDFIIILGKS